jgi:hypothetical protein
VGHLDEATFAKHLQCAACGSGQAVIESYLDRTQHVMVGQADDDGRWAYDGEGFIDGVFAIRCRDCAAVAYHSDDCPRCHARGALAAVRGADSRLTAPRKCPRCNGLELSVVGFAPARTEVAAGRPGKAVPQALFGEPGFHVVAVACRDCEWAEVSEGCPLCSAPPPLRKRPG